MLAAAVLQLAAGNAYCHKAGGDAAESSRLPVQKPGYAPPAPGTYRLPPIQQAVNGTVIDADDGKRHHLFDLMADKVVVFSFIYSACAAPGGCPLATATLNDVRRKLEQEPALAGRVRFLSLSFDMARDSPEVLRHYADYFGVDRARRLANWRFLSAASRADLQQLLDGYGQYIVREFDEQGRHTGNFSHVLKVFLIDPERRVRNIYSTSFLYPELLVNDIKTLVLEAGERGKALRGGK